MRGRGTSADKLHASDPALAEISVAINRNLDIVTMSVEKREIGWYRGCRGWSKRPRRLYHTGNRYQSEDEYNKEGEKGQT